MTGPTFLRARRPEQKQQRHDAILDAARDLAMTSGVRNVSLGAVAEAVDLAKSNISRYFGTREEIYLELLADEWERFSKAVVVQLQEAAGLGDAIAALAQEMVQRPLFCDLLSHLPTSLELNVSAEAARTFKRAAHQQMGATGAALASSTPLTTSEGTELVGAAAGMAGLLYRATNPPPVLAEVYTESPELNATHGEMLPTLERLLTALAAGLPTLRGKTP